MGSLEAYFGTVDNPAYDPDGEEPTFNLNSSTGGISTQQTLVFKEEKAEQAKSKHEVKFSRRRSKTRTCIIVVTVLTLILVGIAVGIYFLLSSSRLSKKPIEIKSTRQVEGQFRILNRQFTSALNDPRSSEYVNLTTDITQTIQSVFPKDSSPISVSHVYITDLSSGSVKTTYRIVLLETYNTTYAETQVEELFFLAARAKPNRKISLGVFIIDMLSITFKAMSEAGPTRASPSSVMDQTEDTVTADNAGATTRGSLHTEAPIVTNRRCEPIAIPLCRQNITEQVTYGQTTFPNLMGHLTQSDAADDLWLYDYTAESSCHPHIHRFICATLVPKCGADAQALPPCRRFCHEVFTKCSGKLHRFQDIDCDEFPDSEDENVCVVAPAIPTLAMRLGAGLGPKEGHVEVYIGGSWGVLCDSGWDDKDAEVVCRQLKISGTAKAYSDSHFGPSTRSAHFHDIHCGGDEPHLAMCAMDEGPGPFCGEESVAGVICDADNRDVHLSVRLYGGTSPTSGRLEVLYNNTWGTVCDDSFGEAEATVVCSMINERFTGRISQQASHLTVAESAGPIWLSSLSCDGSEASLVECSHDPWGSDGHMCDHSEDVFINCAEGTEEGIDYDSLELRLSDGPSQSEGRVEIYHQGVWGTVCHDMLFDENTVKVMCRTLGLSTFGIEDMKVRYGPGSGQIWLSGLMCTGSESHIADCPRDALGDNTCTHLQDVSIKCGAPPSGSEFQAPPPEFLARLAYSDDPHRGRLELYADGDWGTVCEHNFDDKDATVACRMIGYSANTTGRFLGNEYGGGASSQRILMDRLQCNGNEMSLHDTSCAAWPEIQVSCMHSQDVSIECNIIPDLQIFQLSEGASHSEGYLEVRHDAEWGTVCKEGFSHKEATVACRNLGYSSGVVVPRERSEPSTVWLSGLRCEGSEATLLECNHHGWNNNTCDEWDGHVYIACDPVRTSVRLGEKGSQTEGLVMVEINGNWGTVCDFATKEEETAVVVCKSLGYTNVTVDSVEILDKPNNLDAENITMPIFLSEVDCTGTEWDILHCDHESTDTYCDHTEDLYIRCTQEN